MTLPVRARTSHIPITRASLRTERRERSMLAGARRAAQRTAHTTSATARRLVDATAHRTGIVWSRMWARPSLWVPVLAAEVSGLVFGAGLVLSFGLGR